MSGVEETVAVGCFQKFLNCCPSQRHGDDVPDGNDYTDVKVEMTLVCCGGNNERRSDQKSGVKWGRYKTRSSLFLSSLSFEEGRKNDVSESRNFSCKETQV